MVICVAFVIIVLYNCGTVTSLQSSTLTEGSFGSIAQKGRLRKHQQKPPPQRKTAWVEKSSKSHKSSKKSKHDDKYNRSKRYYTEPKPKSRKDDEDESSDSKGEREEIEDVIEDVVESIEDFASDETSFKERVIGTSESKFSSKDITTIQLLHPEALGKCMVYDSTLDEKTIYMADCSNNIEEMNADAATVTTSTAEDHWEILESLEQGLFYLRHKSSQLCIPKNPENPAEPFDCSRYSGEDDEAIADSINGLVDCTSGFAARMRRDPNTNSLYLYNSDCESDMDIIFMSYSIGEEPDERQTIVWGEKILLELEDDVETLNFQREWEFVNVTL